MSGIFGILNFDNSPAAQIMLEKMQNTLAHRGPDGMGIWKENNIALGQMRLNITPESEYENLPFENQDCVLVGDYRLDNRDDLIKQLGMKPATNHPVTDANIIVSAYIKWGEACAVKFLGDFIFVIWDKKKQELFFVRDFFGTKTVFYYEDAKQFVFASEIKAIVATGIVSRKLNEDAISDFLFFFSYDPQTTFFKNINHLLPPAHYLIIGKNKKKLIKYWELQSRKTLKLNSDDEYCHALLEVFSKAVISRSRTNYPVGIMLSGGLDSSSIACLLARKLLDEGKTMYAASSVLPENHKGYEIDEREYIQALLEQEKNIALEYTVPPNRLSKKELFDLFQKFETPVNSFYYMDKRLIQNLKNHNVRSIYNGIPGDGIVSFQGHNVFAQLALELKFKKMLSLAIKQSKIEKYPIWKILTIDVILPIIHYYFSLNIPLRNKSDLQGRSLDDTLNHFSLNTKYKTQRESINKYTKRINNNLKQNTVKVFSGLKYISNTYINNSAIEETHNTKAYSQFEFAYPFLDRNLFEFMVNVPADKLLMDGWRRGYIRKTMDGILPSTVQWRKNKMPFSPNYKHLYYNELVNMNAFYNKLNPSHIIWDFFDKNSIENKINKISQTPVENIGKELLVFSRIYNLSQFIDFYFGEH